MKEFIRFLRGLWPVWFPYPSAWMNVFTILLLLSPLALSVRFFGQIGIGAASASGNLGPVVLLGAISLIVPFVPLAYLYSFLWGDHPAGWPRRLPSPKSIWDASYALGVFLVAFVSGVVVVSFCFNIGQDIYTQQEFDRAAIVGGLTWFVTALYLYQAKVVIWRGIIDELEVKALDDAKAGLISRRVTRLVQDESPFGDFDPKKFSKRQKLSSISGQVAKRGKHGKRSP